jgi:predicted ester cyclase
VHVIDRDDTIATEETTMKLRSIAMVMMGVGALTAAGCKKKPKEQKAPPEPGAQTMGSGSAGGMAGSAEAPKPEAKLEGKALADKYLACTGYINDAKFDDFTAKCVAKDYKGHNPGGEEISGPEGLLTMFKDQKAAFPDFKLTPQLVMVSGRDILAVQLITGTNSGPMKGEHGEMPATNKKIGALMFHRLAMNDENRAAEEWAFHDPATIISQLGLMPKGVPPMRPAMDKGIEGAPITVVSAGDDKEKKNLEAVQKGNAAFTSKKSADFMAYYTDDAVESDQAGDKDHKGKKDIQAGAEMFLKAFPDLKMETPNIYAAGDYVVQIGTFSGTNTGAMGPMKPTKKAVNGAFAEVIQMKDGKMAYVWRFRDGLTMAKQMGLVPEMPAGGGSAAPAGDKAGSAAPAKDDKAGSAAPVKSGGAAAPAKDDKAGSAAKKGG